MQQRWVLNDNEVIGIAEGERFLITAKMFHWIGFEP
jgi:hypothetical protein